MSSHLLAVVSSTASRRDPTAVVCPTTPTPGPKGVVGWSIPLWCSSESLQDFGVVSAMPLLCLTSFPVWSFVA